MNMTKPRRLDDLLNALLVAAMNVDVSARDAQLARAEAAAVARAAAGASAVQTVAQAPSIRLAR